MKTRVGIGYDSHRFVDGDGFVLGGVFIPGTVRMVGHSDADALLHAISDAILGGAGLGDIGEMFPNTDPANAGRSSVEMLSLAAARCRDGGWMPVQIDATVICEKPKIGPHRETVCAKIADVLGLDAGAVMVKGKTNEKMGWIGRGEGLAVIAVATLESA